MNINYSTIRRQMEKIVLLILFVMLCGAVRDEDFMEFIHINTDLQAKYQVINCCKICHTKAWVN